MVQSAAKFTGYMLNPISHDLVRPHQVRDCNILLRDCEQSESEQIDLRRASSTHHNRIYPTSRPHRNEPIPLHGDEADDHAAAAHGRRARKTDAVLALSRFARGGLTRQLAGRLAHARRARGDG